MSLVRVAALVATACVASACGSRAPTTPTAPTAPVADLPGAEPLTPPSLPIALRRSVVADEYFWLRAKVLEGEAPAAFAEAYAAMQELRGAFSADPDAWEDLEVPLGQVSRPSELVAAYAELPEKKDVGGTTVAFRAPALALARAIQKTAPAFRAGPYKAHEAEIARAAKELSALLVPNEQALVRAIASEMALPEIDRPIVVTLVSDAPYPGNFAADASGRTTASFVRVHGLDGGALVETVLHEVLDAYDEITVRSPTAMNALRGALKDRGIDEADPGVEMAVNTVMFAEAGSLVRRFVLPAHKPMGESGFYVLYPPAPRVVEAWNRHLEGEALDATADAIAQAVAQP